MPQMLLNITQFNFHTSFLKLICAKLGIYGLLHLTVKLFVLRKLLEVQYTASTHSSTASTINIKHCEGHQQCFCFGCDGRRMHHA